jgi:hypothetical protein
MDARLRPRTLAINAHHHCADTAIAVESDRLQAETEIAARDPTMGFELGGDPRDRRGGNDEHTPARTKNGHAEGPPGRSNDEPTFGMAAQFLVKLNASVDVAAAHRSPRRTADCNQTPGHNRLSCLGADRHCQRAGCGHSVIKGGRHDVAGLDADQRDVGGRVAPDNRCLFAASVWKRHGDIALVSERIIGGEDQLCLPGEP